LDNGKKRGKIIAMHCFETKIESNVLKIQEGKCPVASLIAMM